MVVFRIDLQSKSLSVLVMKLTCDQTGDNERQHKHLQHPHQELSREREVLDLLQGQVVGT